jgi:hypothetical protein
MADVILEGLTPQVDAVWLATARSVLATAMVE